MSSGDIALKIRTDDTIDMVVAANDLLTDDGIETAVIMSLFSDQRILEEEVEDGINDRRGWWGDEFSGDETDQIGSKLWLLDRSKTEQETLNRAKQYAEDALQWMKTDGIADRVEANAVYDANKIMVLTILIYRPGQKEPYKFEKKWNTESNRDRSEG